MLFMLLFVGAFALVLAFSLMEDLRVRRRCYGSRCRRYIQEGVHDMKCRGQKNEFMFCAYDKKARKTANEKRPCITDSDIFANMWIGVQ